MRKIDDCRVAETGALLARGDFERGRDRDPDQETFWAPAYREGYRMERRNLEEGLVCVTRGEGEISVRTVSRVELRALIAERLRR